MLHACNWLRAMPHLGLPSGAAAPPSAAARLRPLLPPSNVAVPEASTAAGCAAALLRVVLSTVSGSAARFTPVLVTLPAGACLASISSFIAANFWPICASAPVWKSWGYCFLNSASGMSLVCTHHQYAAPLVCSGGGDWEGYRPFSNPCFEATLSVCIKMHPAPQSP